MAKGNEENQNSVRMIYSQDLREKGWRIDDIQEGGRCRSIVKKENADLTKHGKRPR